ncbi:MAG: hypothetical protein S4CHLAM20_08200 [Chlamydiia bacterium]|nr:hypothetical protein [Chlamydiia bacterium]
MAKFIIIFACAFATCAKPPEHVQVSDKSVEFFVESIKTKDLVVLAIGGFYENKKVENLYLDLEYQGEMSSKFAKIKLLKIARGMLAHINRDEQLRPFLIKKRFSSKDISVSLAYTSKEGVSSQVHVYEGKVIFSTYDKTTNQLTKVHSESLSL